MCGHIDKFLFEPGDLRGHDPGQSADQFHDADPPKGSHVSVFFAALTDDEIRVIIKQSGKTVAAFYTQDVGVAGEKNFTSDGGKVQYEFTACENGNWEGKIPQVNPPTRQNNVRKSEVFGVVANLVFQARS